MWEDATGNLAPKTDGALTYAANTGLLTATGFVGPLTGQADTVGTIAGLAPDTATTQATQASITTCANLVSIGTIATGVWEATDVGISYGGTGQSTAQLAINALTAVSGATNEHVLTKDTGTGNATWKAASGGAGSNPTFETLVLTDLPTVDPAGIEIDYMEYANDGAAQAAYVTDSEFESFISNADIDDEDMADISDWSDADSGSGVSSQATFDGESTMKLDTGGSTPSSSRRLQDLGSFATRTVFSFRLYCDNIGTFSNQDRFDLEAGDGTIKLHVTMVSDGLFVYDGSSWNEVGTDIVVQDAWQEWSFDVDWVAGTVDVYLGQSLVQADVAIDTSDASNPDGEVQLTGFGVTTVDQIAYVDWFKAGTDATEETPALQSYSEDTIKEQGTYSLKVIAAITTSLNDTVTRTVGPTIDLSGQDDIFFKARASRTGTQFKVAIHDSGGTTTEHAVNIASANVWQTETWDISGVSDANKDDIDQIIITVTNAGAENTIYLDDVRAGVATPTDGMLWNDSGTVKIYTV